MSLMEKAKEIVRNYPITEELRRYGEDNIGTFEDKQAREYYYNGVASVYLKKELDGEVLSECLNYYIEIDTDSIISEDKVPLGTSKLKGLPHLPDSIKWPEGYYFYAQLNFRELKQYDIEDLFPNEGILYIFFDTCDFKLFYYNGSQDNLAVTPYPTEMELPGKEYYFQDFPDDSSIITFSPHFIFYMGGDAYGYSEITELIPEDLKTKLSAILKCDITDRDVDTRIFGQPTCWQGEFECYDDKELQHFISFDNILLFQDQFGEGNFQIWMGKKDLKQGDFSICDATFSCT